MGKYTRHVGTRRTPQSEPIPGTYQVRNSAGGYAFPVDDWVRLDRFLVLGSEGGSYYATERELTRANADSVLRCIQTDGQRTVMRIREISVGGRAPKNDPAIFALAMAAKLGDDDTRKLAYSVMPQVCRIGTYWFQFAEAMQAFGGWGRGAKTAIGKLYQADVARVAYQAIKYRQRNGWTHADMLRLSHPKAPTGAHRVLYSWIVDGDEALKGVDIAGLNQLFAFNELATETNPRRAAQLIREHRLPREAVPTTLLNEPVVWEALLDDMPLTALIRNLATMTRVGVVAPFASGTTRVLDALGSPESLHKARIHPIAVLAALLTYQAGRGARGHHTWAPVQSVVDALDAAFYAAFDNVEPTGKNWYLALDVSGSMGQGEVAGVPGLTPRVAAAAMAMVIARIEKQHVIKGFQSGRHRTMHYGYDADMVELSISPRRRLDDIVRQITNLPLGGTDCALPMIDALEHRTPADIFVVLTDSETWAGSIHPMQALNDFRRTMGIPAKLVTVGMVANDFSIADPNDAGSMDVVGFDTAAPTLIHDFAR
jgi:60 kDa SS-A/Ro ribonucleoprotein